MPRGGRREGAGRKPDIPPELAKAIRDDCESHSEVQRQQQALALLDRQLRRRGIVWEEDSEPNPIYQVPLKYRSIVSKYGSEQPDRKIPEDLPDQVVYAIDTMRANKKALGDRRFYSTPLPGLYGKRQAIIKAVAKTWGVSPRTVRTIWESVPDV